MHSVLIVGDCPVVRFGIKSLLRQELAIRVFGEAATAAEAKSLLHKSVWSLIVIDSGHPDNDRFLQQLRLRASATPCLMLGESTNLHYEARALNLGAQGYIPKNTGAAELLKAVRTILAGKNYVSRRLPLESGPEVTCKALSKREQKVLRALAAGQSPTQIAAELELSVKTVSTYKRSIFDKLHLKSMTDLVLYVLDRHPF